MKDQDVLGSHVQVREHFEHRLAVAAGSDEEISPRGSLDAGRVTPGDADARVLHGVQGVGMLDVVLIRAFGPAGRRHTIIVLQPLPLLYYTCRWCEDRGMEILALAIASLSLLVAIVGTYLANAREGSPRPLAEHRRRYTVVGSTGRGSTPHRLRPVS